MRFGPILATLGLSLVAAACNNPSATVGSNEDMMAASGFKFVPANTPARQAALKGLPPHKFVRQIKDGRVIYVYADPTICACLYVGGQKAYGTYNKNRLDKKIADERAQTAELNEVMAADSWDWGTWGAGYPLGWPYSDPAFFY